MIERFYKELLAASPDKANEEPEGWQYANLTLSSAEENRTHFDETAVSDLSDSGTAFVVHPGYAVTALHLVRDANRLLIEFPGQEPVEAVMEKFSEVYDIAFLKLAQQDVPPLPVNSSLKLRPDMLLTQLGFPAEQGPATMRQIEYSDKTSLDDSDFMVFQAPPIRGLRGGPVCDASGNVIGIATSIGAMDGGQTTVIPIRHMISLLEKHVPAYSLSRKTEKTPLEAAVVETRLSPSIGRLAVYKKYLNFGIGKSTVPTYALDTKSSCCGDTGVVKCGVKGCNEGQVSVLKKVKIGWNPIAGNMMAMKRFKEPCKVCHGTGGVPCQFPD